MALTKLDQIWVQAPSPSRTACPTSCPGTLLQLPSPRILAMSQSLYCVVREGNKADRYRLKDLWQFKVTGLDEVLGYMRDYVRKNMLWTDRFHVDEKSRTVTLTPDVRYGETPAVACKRAFSELCLQNRGRFNNCFDRWLTKPLERRDFHPIHNTDAKWQDLSMPVPARGLFGIVTIGVHLNMYTVHKLDGREIVDRIWVSERARGDNDTYPGMLDQVVAGGMDPTDHVDGHLAPGVTLMREAAEEAGLVLDLETKTMSTSPTSGRQVKIGTVAEAPRVTFYDCKGHDAGRTNEGHLEPGVRYVYDIKLDNPTFQPQKHEKSISKFEALSVDQVKKGLIEKQWKPNCGLVMLDFLVRKNLVTEADEGKFADIKRELHRSLPFKFTEECFPHLAEWE